MDITIIIIFSIIGISVFIVTIMLFLKKYKTLNASEFFTLKKIKCFCKSCEIWIRPTNENKRYCDFHFQVQKFHILFAENKNSFEKKTRMYMNTNAMLYSENTMRKKIFKDLELEAKKCNSINI